ncbi:MAG TPA: PIN domain-containing protein [Vicinamibacterales bacterium]|nr:PIN domain-containing protein [Vicinamibacterales bacterium]
MLNVDTHVLLYALTGTLKPGERRVLGADQWSISAIVLWEIAKLAQLGRISIDLEDVAVVRVLARIHVWPLTREIAHASTRLDVRGDPADELIAATSVVHKVPLLTRDRALLKSKVVPLVR